MGPGIVGVEVTICGSGTWLKGEALVLARVELEGSNCCVCCYDYCRTSGSLSNTTRFLFCNMFFALLEISVVVFVCLITLLP